LDAYYRGGVAGQPPAVMQQSAASGNKTVVTDGAVNGTTGVLQPPPVVVASSSSSDRGDNDDDDDDAAAAGGAGGGLRLKDEKNDDGNERSSPSADGQDDGGGTGGGGGGSAGGGAGYASFPLALAVAIGIGCSLLFLNVMIFAVIYYNKSTGWGSGGGGRRGNGRRTSGAGSDADDSQQQRDDRIGKIKKRPENGGGPMSNLCTTGGKRRSRTRTYALRSSRRPMSAPITVGAYRFVSPNYPSDFRYKSKCASWSVVVFLPEFLKVFCPSANPLDGFFRFITARFVDETNYSPGSRRTLRIRTRGPAKLENAIVNISKISRKTNTKPDRFRTNSPGLIGVRVAFSRRYISNTKIA